MSLIKCKECGAEISDQAESCPRCGIKGTGRRSRTWIDSLNVISGTLTAVVGTLVIPVAGATLAWVTFNYKKQSEENEKLQAMVESAVGHDPPEKLNPSRA